MCSPTVKTASMTTIYLITPEHLPHIASIEQDVFPDAWGYDVLSQCHNNPPYRMLAALDGGTVVGYLIALLIGDEAELLRIAVLPEYRKRGTGSALLEGLLRLCAEASVSRVTLEVRAKNPAVEFYLRRGFKEFAVRREYYSNPADDAVLMEKIIIQKGVH